jgi:hypothetical protein
MVVAPQHSLPLWWAGPPESLAGAVLGWCSAMVAGSAVDHVLVTLVAGPYSRICMQNMRSSSDLLHLPVRPILSHVRTGQSNVHTHWVGAGLCSAVPANGSPNCTQRVDGRIALDDAEARFRNPDETRVVRPRVYCSGYFLTLSSNVALKALSHLTSIGRKT